MKKDELILNCRYYKGENKCPFETYPLNWFWDMERVYVENGGEAGGEATYYLRLGGKQYPGIPLNLVTVMFTSWGKFNSDIKNTMSKFYALVDDYLNAASDHYKTDKLPSVGFID